ncbi:Dihydroorotase [Mycena filopes]|nr:Dihydroorotase [Mycena filopes]
MPSIAVPSPADFHVHLRQGSLAKLVTPHVRRGGFALAYVMPNLKPPITTTAQALAYKAELEEIDPTVQYLMTLYLSPDLTPEEIVKAKDAGIVGVKSYPRGVTTNSDGGIESYEMYYPVFEAMQRVDMVLNLHGEVPSDAATNVHVLNAEPQFLPHLHSLHKAFPRLLACTITAHHLALTVDDWAGQSFNFCKPVPKYPDDREALRQVVKEGVLHYGPPVLQHQGCAAGIYTSPILLPLVAHLLESFDALDRLSDFASTFGRRFYQCDLNAEETLKVVLQRSDAHVVEKYGTGEESVVPFWAGKQLGWKIVSN